MTTDNDALARAGRAGLEAWRYVGSSHVDELVANARAVLESLGINWTGDWEWGIDLPHGQFVAFKSEEKARAGLASWEDDPDAEAVTLQRRPKLNVEWEDVSN